jgi:hypothetical protein
MPSAYPGAIDSFTIPGGTLPLGGSVPTHTAAHQAIADAIVAIQTALGANPFSNGIALSGGAFAAGSISQDGNWGQYFRGVGAQTVAAFGWANAAGSVIMSLTAAGFLVATGPVRPGVYTVATIPAAGTAGRMAFATNGRKNGEGPGAGTGVLAFDDGTAWRACDTGATLAA